MIAKDIWIVCDECGKRSDGYADLWATMQAARQQGWQIGAKHMGVADHQHERPDYCPDCARTQSA